MPTDPTSASRALPRAERSIKHGVLPLSFRSCRGSHRPAQPAQAPAAPDDESASLRREVLQTPGPLALELRMPAGRDAGPGVRARRHRRRARLVERPRRGHSGDRGRADRDPAARRRSRRDRRRPLPAAVRVVVRPWRDHDARQLSERRRCRRLDGVRRRRDPRQARRALRGDRERRPPRGGARRARRREECERRHLARPIGADASVTAASGDVFIRSVHGEAIVRTASGDVRVEEAADSITAQTASGDLRIGSATAGRVALQSASGDQQVGIRRGSAVHLDVRTMSGDATSELEVRDERPAPARRSWSCARPR